MAHVAKFTRGTCGLLSRHYDRYKDKEHPEEVKYKNQDIDPERTHLNYNLAPMREQMPYLKKRLEEVHCLIGWLQLLRNYLQNIRESFLR